jgi:hypothetical protein
MEPIAHTGEVIFTDKKKGFGFLKSESHPKIFFLFGNSMFRKLSKEEFKACRKTNPTTRYIPNVGDCVTFKLKNSDSKPGSFEAFEVRFITNPDQEKFMEHMRNQDELLGDLHWENEKYYILDSTYKVQIPLQKNVWRLLNNEDLQGHIGSTFPYVIINKAKSFKNLDAELADEFINPEYFDLQEDAKAGLVFEGKITGRDKKSSVYFVKISSYKGSGILLCRDSPGLEKGDVVEVKISNVFPSGLHLRAT